MYDADKAKLLQQQSHVRGMLSKQFYSGQQSQLEKKRREMKRILDQQVQQKRRIKQRQKQQIQRRQRKQQDQIKKYYEQVVHRERRLSDNNSNVNAQRNYDNQNNFQSQNQNLVDKSLQRNVKQRLHSKTTLQDIDGGNIPLLPVMSMNGERASFNTNNNVQNSNNNQYHSSNYDRENEGNIPLLDLSDEVHFSKNKKKGKVQTKRQKTDRQNHHLSLGVGASSAKFQQSKNPPQYNRSFPNVQFINPQIHTSVQSSKRNQTRKTLSDQQNSSLIQQHNNMNSRVSKGSKMQQSIFNKLPSNSKRSNQMQIPLQIQQMQNENKMLKSELKKSQQAISLLIGAVRSNVKLDKFRLQAQKILRSQENYYIQQHKRNQKKQQSPLLLPKLNIKHQSIMHDYLLEAAKKARLKHIKSQACKY